jgi:23S rRNA (uracil-5-)-methyltransferase RumA
LSLTPDTEIVLVAEKPAVGGRMLARHEGQIVFVGGAIPGERVRVRVERVSKQLAYAEVTEVLEASSDRRPSNVDWACAGSAYAHVSYPRQLSLKSELVADAFSRIGKIALPGATPVMGSEEHGYRMRARLHAQGGRFGFFHEGTHELCDAGATNQLLASTIAALGQLQATLGSNTMEEVISCEISENISASERAALLELDGSRALSLKVEAVAGLTGLAFTNRLNSRLTVAYGTPYVVDHVEISGVSAVLTHHVQSFFQGNRYLLTRLVERVVAQVPDGEVTDLYAGVGLFAVSLAASGRIGITAVEGDRSSAHDLEANAAPYGNAISVEHSPVERYLQRRSTQRPQTLVLDPPRTGMSRDAMAGLLRLKPRRIVYVSCDLATLARDVKELLEESYRLEHIEAFDLFPNTAHVETLAILESRI